MRTRYSFGGCDLLLDYHEASFMGTLAHQVVERCLVTREHVPQDVGAVMLNAMRLTAVVSTDGSRDVYDREYDLHVPRVAHMPELADFISNEQTVAGYRVFSDTNPDLPTQMVAELRTHHLEMQVQDFKASIDRADRPS